MHGISKIYPIFIAAIYIFKRTALPFNKLKLQKVERLKSIVISNVRVVHSTVFKYGSVSCNRTPTAVTINEKRGELKQGVLN